MLNVALTPCSIGSLVWTRETNEQRTTIVVKRTYRLQPGLPLSDTQETVRDERAQSSIGALLDRPNDLVPYKARVDCFVVGARFSATGADGPTFELVLRRAGGQFKRLRAEPPGSLRRTSLGGPGRILRSAPPSTSDAEAFQTAPVDQRLDDLLTGDLLELHHAEEVTLGMPLPTTPPGALLFGDAREPRPIGLRFDTLLIDGDQGVVTMTARADFTAVSEASFVVVTETPAFNLHQVFHALEAHPTAAPWLRAWAELHSASPDGSAVRRRPGRTTRRFKVEPTAADDGARVPAEPLWLNHTARTNANVSSAGAQPAWAAPTALSASPEQHATLVLEVPEHHLLAEQALAVAPPARVELAASPREVAETSFVAYEEDPREAQLPSYLKGRPKREAPPPLISHDGLAALAGVAAASDAATNGAARRSHRDTSIEAPSALLDALDVLFIDDRALKETGVSAALEVIIGEPSAHGPARDAARSWAHRPPPVDLKARARAAIVSGHVTPLSKVGFRTAPADQRIVVDADVVRVAGVFEPVLSRLQIMKTMVRVASLAITEESRAADLAALSRALDDDLEYAPEAAFASLIERLERACDGADGRPDTATVRSLAESTVLAKRGTSRSVLREGTWVRGTLRDGAVVIPMVVPEAFERTLPNHARWNAVALVRPVLSQDTREPSTMVLATIAMGRYVDPNSLAFRADD